MSSSGSRANAAVSVAGVATSSRSVSKITGSFSPFAGAAAACVPAGTTAGTSVPAASEKVSGTRAGCGGSCDAPSRSRNARKFLSGTRLSRWMISSVKRPKTPISAAPSASGTSTPSSSSPSPV